MSHLLLIMDAVLASSLTYLGVESGSIPLILIVS
jgi:hypothetical protein